MPLITNYKTKKHFVKTKIMIDKALWKSEAVDNIFEAVNNASLFLHEIARYFKRLIIFMHK